MLRLLATTRVQDCFIYQVGLARPSGRALAVLVDHALSDPEEARRYQAKLLDDIVKLLDLDDWVTLAQPITHRPRLEAPPPDWTAGATVGPLRLLATSPGGDRFLYQVGTDQLTGRPLAVITYKPISQPPAPAATNVKILDNIVKFLSLETWTLHAQPEIGPSRLKRS